MEDNAKQTPQTPQTPPASQTPPPPTGGPVYQPSQQRYSQHPEYAQVPPVANAHKGGRGYIVAIVAIVAICLVIIASIASCSSVVGSMYGMFDLSEDAGMEASDGTPKIGVISIAGTIQYDGTECSPSGLRSLLDAAEERDDIKAVVLRVDSGGGTSTAGEEMSHYVKDFSKPVVVSSASMNASAAYEISSQADYIFTAKSTAIGSIGTAMEVTDLSGLYEKLGIKIDAITSAESKDSSYGNRPLTEEERAWYQRMVNQINDEFINTVAEGRSMGVDEVRNLANGLTFTGIDAVENGLADEVGYLEDAVAYASELAGSKTTLEMTSLTLSSDSNLLELLELLSENESKSADEQALEALIDKYGENGKLG